MAEPYATPSPETLARAVAQALGRGGHPGAVVIPVPNLGNAPPGFADRYNNLFSRTIDLTNARLGEPIEITGNFLWVFDATDPTSWVNIQLNDQSNTPIRAQLGLLLSGFKFSRAYLTHDAQAGHSMTLVYAVQEPGLNLFVQNPSQIVSTVQIARASTLGHGNTTAAAGVATQIVAANGNRHEILLQVRTATRTVYFGADNTVTVNDGIRLDSDAAGISGVLTLATTDAIWALSAANAVVSYLELAT